MKKFAFIVSPANIRQLKSLWPASRLIPDFLIWLFSNSLPRFKLLRVKEIRSKQGKAISGFLVICPLFPQQASSLGEELILDRIIFAGNAAHKMGAKIVGLDFYPASIADKEFDTVSKSLKVPITSGHALTAWSIFEGIFRVAKARKIDLRDSSIAVKGDANIALNLAVKKLSDHLGKLIPESYTEEEAKNADIVIRADPGCSIWMNLRSEPASIELGLIKLPFALDWSRQMGLAGGVVPAALAETMLLAFEDKFISYSLGDYINPDKLEEIADIAVRHGFEVWVPQAPLL